MWKPTLQYFLPAQMCHVAVKEGNRTDWSHIPSGVISGASLVKPDYMELKEFPFLWYQTEYVIGGAATYIFDILAADKLLNEK